jgi:hypothetical protein
VEEATLLEAFFDAEAVGRSDESREEAPLVAFPARLATPLAKDAVPFEIEEAVPLSALLVPLTRDEVELYAPLRVELRPPTAEEVALSVES